MNTESDFAVEPEDEKKAVMRTIFGENPSPVMDWFPVVPGFEAFPLAYCHPLAVGLLIRSL